MTLVSAGFGDTPEYSGADRLALFGPTIAMRVGFDSGYRLGQFTPPALPTESWPALIDTGALESCIDSELARALELPIVDYQTVAGAHGAAALNYHLAHIYIPDLNYTIYGEFAGVHLTAGGLYHKALLGRTFLSRITMTYEGRAGQVTLSND